MSSLTYSNGSLLLRTPYSAALVADLKSLVPASERKWDGTQKAWAVAPEHAALLVDLVRRHCRETVTIPSLPTLTARRETRVLEVRYVGACKDRGDGNRTAFGWSNGEWAVIFTEQALRDWFADQATPGEQATLYAVLGLQQTALPADIKPAFRRLAKQWHPDVCKEPGAADVFRKVNHAYEVLSDPNMRQRYDAGLKLQALADSSRQHGPVWAAIGDPRTSGLAALLPDGQGYRSPLRCGILIVEGVEKMGRFIVSKIEAWEDITDRQGRVLVVSWPAGATKFSEAWT